MVTAAPPSKVAGPVRSDGNKRAPLLPAYRALLLSRTHIRWTRFPRRRGTRTVSPEEGPMNELAPQEIGWLTLLASSTLRYSMPAFPPLTYQRFETPRPSGLLD